MLDMNADLGIFFDTSEFAKVMLFKPKGGPNVSITGIVQLAGKQMEDSLVLRDFSSITCMRSEIPVVSISIDKIEIDGIDWTIVKEIGNDEHVVTYEIRRDMRARVSR